MNKLKFSKKSFVYVIILILVLYILFFDSASFYQTYKIKHKLASLQKDIDTLLQENERLKVENQKLEKDKATWEKKAREIGMKKEGEEIFIFKESDDL
ncbi:MAG: septum formation initiator family protein [Candidatus Cloacimonetes bacterium]|nr:septum formation initiator family protein [Candidatus Cloacimonadota bacterium]